MSASSTDSPRVGPQWRVVLIALVLGAVAGAMVRGSLDDGGSETNARPDSISGSGVLQTLPEPPLDVTAETVVLPQGFVSHHMHDGPTLNLIVSGSVEVVDDDTPDVTMEYEAGGFFSEPADNPHTITALENTRIDVVRLIPPGGRETIGIE